MLKNFRFSWNNPVHIALLVVGVLVVMNLVAAYFVFAPPGGSPKQLSEEVRTLTSQIRQKKGALERTRALVVKVQAGRNEGDSFLGEYFLPRRTAYTTILGDLLEQAKKVNVTPKESTNNLEPIEGSDDLSELTISANYECEYGNLIRFVNALDKIPRLLIVESLSATPQQGSKLLNVQIKMDTFVREDGIVQ
ncbi:MAG TPA: hypothetical protein VKU01_17910 [Bryobacteraceae bacterium]|nr:hypothetical protein [Bryobacteraceae bacterium]